MNKTIEKHYLTVKEASKYLSLSEGYIYKLTYKKTLPFYKVMGKVLLSVKDLEAFMQQFRNSSIEEIDENIQNNIINRYLNK